MEKEELLKKEKETLVDEIISLQKKAKDYESLLKMYTNLCDKHEKKFKSLFAMIETWDLTL